MKNVYYHTKELMDKAIDFWLYSYREKWFVRWAIKVPVYAVERAAAAEAFGFEKTDSLLVAKDGVAFNGYWIYKT